MRKISPTQRSLALLRERGYTVAISEHWNAHAGIRQDLFGIMDLIAIHPEKFGVLGVQTTSKANATARLKKAQKNKSLFIWYKAGNNFEIHGWGKDKKTGKWSTEIIEVVNKKYLPKTPRV